MSQNQATVRQKLIEKAIELAETKLQYVEREWDQLEDPFGDPRAVTIQRVITRHHDEIEGLNRQMSALVARDGDRLSNGAGISPGSPPQHDWVTGTRPENWSETEWKKWVWEGQNYVWTSEGGPYPRTDKAGGIEVEGTEVRVEAFGTV